MTHQQAHSERAEIYCKATVSTPHTLPCPSVYYRICGDWENVSVLRKMEQQNARIEADVKIVLQRRITDTQRIQR